MKLAHFLKPRGWRRKEDWQFGLLNQCNRNLEAAPLSSNSSWVSKNSFLMQPGCEEVRALIPAGFGCMPKHHGSNMDFLQFTNCWTFRTYTSDGVEQKHDTSSEAEAVATLETDTSRQASSDWSMSENDDENELSSSESESDRECRSAGAFSPSIVLGENVEALEAALKELEATADPQDMKIGCICLRLAQICDSVDEDPTKVCMYGQRALLILGSQEVSAETAMCYHVIGSAYHKMEEFQKALEQLEKSAMVIKKLGPTKEMEVGALKYAVHFLMGQIKLSLGRHDEALTDFQEGIAINEKILEPGNPDLAMSYQIAAQAFLEAGDNDEALALCQKSLPIYTNYHGANSSEVATLRRTMLIIYNNLEEYEKVLTEYDIIRPILESKGKSRDVTSIDLVCGEALISLERYDEGIKRLKGIVGEKGQMTDISRQAFVQIAHAYSLMEEHKDAAKFCKKAWNALKNQDNVEAGATLVELSAVYRKLNEFDQSLDALRKALSIFEQDPDQKQALAEVEAQMGLLYLLMHKPMEGLSYLDKAAAKLEGIHGHDSEELLPIYNHIAIGNLEIGKLDDALAKFEAARKLALEFNGPDDAGTIAIYRNLANTYSAVGRFEQAIQCQKHVVESMKKTGKEADALEESENTLNELLERRILSKKNSDQASL